MRIALITTAFFESTLPLYKHLYNNKKDEVHLYCIFNERFLNCPGFDLSNSDIRPRATFEQIPNQNLPSETLIYLGDATQNMHVFVHKLSLSYFLGLPNAFSKTIIAQEFDIIHFIGFSTLYIPIAKNSKAKIVVSLHEASLKRIKINAKLHIKLIKQLMMQVQNKLVRYINHYTFFSENEEQKFKTLYPNDASKTEVIKFGIFESYQHMDKNSSAQDRANDYILYLGLIREYKGVEFLLETITKSDELSKLSFVVAGKDDVGISDLVPHNVEFLNGFLTDDEMVSLVKQCRFLVLPYTSASQSGLPCLALQFGKPFVFSDVPGLDEYLLDNYNGISFKRNDSASLTQAIKKLMDNECYNQMQTNISDNPFYYKNDWNTIATQFRSCYIKLVSTVN